MIEKTQENITTFTFQTESIQLLDLMINSLYTNKEIFLRELISNASDAIEKLKFLSLKTPNLLETDIDLHISIEIDNVKKTLSIIDNGVGMTEDELIKNLGTIAKSGTKEFLKNLPKTENEKSQMIGKFGVGFYSSFIVAKKIIVLSKKAGTTTEDGTQWESEGINNFSIKKIKNIKRGTTITLLLKDTEDEFLNPWKIKNIITKYSDHITVPIIMQNNTTTDTTTKEIINTASALWTLPKYEITEKQYNDLYKSLSNDYNNPLLYAHNIIEGTINYTSLLYIPSKFSQDFLFPEKTIGIKLYIKRVFIMSTKSFLPNYLRFICGIIDSEDIKINISRETIQENIQLKKLKTSLTQKILTILKELSINEQSKYNIFWNEFGQILKEGPGEDPINKDKIADLLRFNTIHKENILKNIALKDYIKSMLEKQTKIYYISAENQNTALTNPHLELFLQKNIKVLLLCDRIDEWLIIHLTEYLGYKFQSIVKSGIENDDLLSEKHHDKITENKIKENDTIYQETLKQLKTCLEDVVKDVKLTTKLINSPTCIVIDEFDVSLEMTKIVKESGQQIRKTKPVLEINPKHEIINYLTTLLNNKEKFSLLAHILYEQAYISDGGKLENPNIFIKNVNLLIKDLILAKK